MAPWFFNSDKSSLSIATGQGVVLKRFGRQVIETPKEEDDRKHFSFLAADLWLTRAVMFALKSVKWQFGHSLYRMLWSVIRALLRILDT